MGTTQKYYDPYTGKKIKVRYYSAYYLSWWSILLIVLSVLAVIGFLVWFFKYRKRVKNVQNAVVYPPVQQTYQGQNMAVPQTVYQPQFAQQMPPTQHMPPNSVAVPMNSPVNNQPQNMPPHPAAN